VECFVSYRQTCSNICVIILIPISCIVSSFYIISFVIFFSSIIFKGMGHGGFISDSNSDPSMSTPVAVSNTIAISIIWLQTDENPVVSRSNTTHKVCSRKILDDFFCIWYFVDIIDSNTCSFVVGRVDEVIILFVGQNVSIDIIMRNFSWWNFLLVVIN
jgi:hypothetical protein